MLTRFLQGQHGHDGYLNFGVSHAVTMQCFKCLFYFPQLGHGKGMKGSGWRSAPESEVLPNLLAGLEEHCMGKFHINRSIAALLQVWTTSCSVHNCSKM
jgi:hypothetical protein